MTFYQKFIAKHPGRKLDGYYIGCPSHYLYEYRQPDENCDENCEQCWNRQMPEDDYIKEKEVNKSMTKTKVEQHLELVTALNKLYEQKNHDYGDSFGKSYAEDGLVMAKIRISDKFNRFKTLIKSDAKVNDESIRDTLIDLANYALMTVMELDNEKENK